MSRAATEKEYQRIVQTLRDGYRDDGVYRYPDYDTAFCIVLEANLGCRIGDILDLRTDSIVKDGEFFKLNIREQKTGKSREFIVPEQVVEALDDFMELYPPKDGKVFHKKKCIVERHIRQVTNFLGISGVTSHSFRKMAANRLYDATGHDIQAVSQWLQHASVKTTMRYIKRSDAQMETAINNIVNLI